MPAPEPLVVTTGARQPTNAPVLTAILVYPMNALANDQLMRIGQYLEASGFAGAIDVRQYDRGSCAPLMLPRDCTMPFKGVALGYR